MICAVLPLKDFDNAKQRLSGALDNAARRGLAQAMAADVLEILAQHPAVARIIVVSNAAPAQQLAQQFGAECWPEPAGAGGLHEVVAGVAGQLVDQAATLLVVHGDLPLLRVDAIDQLLDQHSRQDKPAVTLAPDRHAAGTNCLLASPPLAIPFHYGADSLHRHRDAAQRRGVSVAVVEAGSTGLDIDTPQDLALLARSTRVNRHTRQLMQSPGWRRLSFDDPAPHRIDAPPVDPNRLLDELAGAAAPPDDRTCRQLAEVDWRDENACTRLLDTARSLRDRGFGNVVTYSRKVFVPLTHLCRDVCHYCTFARTPKHIDSPFMSVEDVLRLVREGQAMGCREALFTLGEKPELRYRAARDALAAMGFASTLDYLAHVAERVLRETGVLPHINAGCMTAEEIARLRAVSASMGIMLESSSPRLCERGMPHYGSPDKVPAVRLETLRRAGEARVPFTSGILIGIGETRGERIESLLALRDLHRRYGHLQEIIIQNFRAKPRTKMARAPEPDLEELVWTIAVARLIFGPDMSIQAPPNLSPGVLGRLVDAGINDWGGVSPLTPDHVNPEAPWPHLQQLARETAGAGKHLHERLTVYPAFVNDGERWLDPAVRERVQQLVDGAGLPRLERWCAGDIEPPPYRAQDLQRPPGNRVVSAATRNIVARARGGEVLTERELEHLFEVRGAELAFVCAEADDLRRELCGDTVSFVVNRNINYTNICYFKCRFCAFSKGKLADNLRGRPYDLAPQEIARRCEEAWQRGATEVCMQGGIHPDYDGNTYLEIVKTVRAATPAMHIHAFSPLEVWQGAATLGLSLEDYLRQLRAAGLDTLPGTAAEILDDTVRAQICPDKINTEQWLAVMEAAHRCGFRTTATMMFGHVDHYRHWARHLLRIRQLQDRTNGFTEFVPLPFVPMEAPMYLRGRARPGPTFREVLLVHAVARLALAPVIPNIQTSWVKLGQAGVELCLRAGANDLGGSLMNESITRAAGAGHGQEFSPQRLEAIIRGMGRTPRQRCTDYSDAGEERIAAGRSAPDLVPVVNNDPTRDRRPRSKSRELLANG